MNYQKKMYDRLIQITESITHSLIRSDYLLKDQNIKLLMKDVLTLLELLSKEWSLHKNSKMNKLRLIFYLCFDLVEVTQSVLYEELKSPSSILSTLLKCYIQFQFRCNNKSKSKCLIVDEFLNLSNLGLF